MPIPIDPNSAGSLTQAQYARMEALAGGGGGAKLPGDYACNPQSPNLQIGATGLHTIVPNSLYDNSVANNQLSQIPAHMGISWPISGGNGTFTVTEDGLYSIGASGRLAIDTAWLGYWVSIWYPSQTFGANIATNYMYTNWVVPTMFLAAGVTFSIGLQTITAATAGAGYSLNQVMIHLARIPT